VLESLLPPLDRPTRRGRPPADPRILLDAIFWKFAHHARWKDLPDYYPPMLTCRRYYQRLFLSGRLATLYAALFKDLCGRGRADLPSMVAHGYFETNGRDIALSPAVALTWQLRTALLFIQHAYQVFRCRFGRMDRLGFVL
jgi:transposase